MTRLTSSEAFDVVKKQAATVCNFLELMALSGPLKNILEALYQQKGPSGIYDKSEATQIIVAQATSRGYPAGMVHGKIAAVVDGLYANNYFAGNDERGFYLGSN